MNPSTVKLLRAILLSRTCVPKFISTICTGHSHPMSIALWKLDASWIYSKGTYKAGVSYVLAHQVYNNSWSSFNIIPTPIPPHFHPEPGFDPRIDIPHLHTITIPSLSRQANSLSALSQGPQPLATTDTLSWGKKRRTHLIIQFKRNQGKVHSRQVGTCIDRSTIHYVEVLHNHKIHLPC